MCSDKERISHFYCHSTPLLSDFHFFVRFEVLTAASVAITAFWDIAPWWWKQENALKLHSVYTIVHDATFHKTVIITPALYLGGPGLKSLTRDRLFWRFSWFFSAIHSNTGMMPWFKLRSLISSSFSINLSLLISSSTCTVFTMKFKNTSWAGYVARIGFVRHHS